VYGERMPIPGRLGTFLEERYLLKFETFQAVGPPATAN
jgi:hypothetical protein